MRKYKEFCAKKEKIANSGHGIGTGFTTSIDKKIAEDW
jgi:hypothetical protein